MKISKKIGFGLAIILTALASVALVNKSALADIAPGDIAGATYTFQDGANIIGDFGSSGQVTFTDTNPTDSTRNYKPLSGEFCDPNTNVTVKDGVSKNIKFGINIDSSVNLNAVPIHGDATVSAQVKLGLQQGANGCTGQVFAATITNPGGIGGTDFQWDGSSITTFEGVTPQLSFAKDTQQGVSGEIYLANAGSNNCGASDAILLSAPGANTGKYYQLSDAQIATHAGPGKTSNMSDYPGLAQTNAVSNSSCHVDSLTNITITGTQGQAAPGGPNTVTTSGDADSSCEATAGSSLAWVMCPLFNAASAIVQSTVNIFENLLSFTVAQDLGNASCKINNQGCQASVKLTWSIIKNVASIILVILMLVMVLSQAIGGGPFDAYTIRKLLPKLVAAVIIMQLSWPLVAWIIDIFNDIGKGLQDFLFAPFGGASALNDMGKLINHAGISPVGAAAFNWVAILAVGVATVAALPTALFLAFAALVGLFVGIITLIFRKILIIMLLILSPLAIIAWVLPGTERYWKLWFDNLLKALAMFPLIVAMVAAGRIFAYIAGPQTSGFDGFTAKFLSLLFVLVGFIGPLFILPRTYKWGGSMMSAAGGAINNVGTSLNKKAQEPIKGWTQRQVQGRFAKKYQPKGAPGSNWLNRTATSLAGGRIIPTKYRAAILTQSGDKWNEERDAEAQALLKRKGEIAMKEGYETAVLNDDKTGFAKYDRDASGNILDKGGNIAYTKAGVDKDGKDIFHNPDGSIATDFDKAHKIDVASYDEADKRKLTGVAAMKQMWVDLADESNNSHERKMAIRQLTATSSWPEVQGNLSKKGNKVIDTEAWNSSITTSAEDYPRILRSRVDATPHIDNAAKAALDAENARRRGAGEAELTGVDAKNFISQERILYSIEKQMSNEDFQTQSDGYWEEVARVADMRDASGNLTERSKRVQESLRKRFESIHDIGGTAPQQLLGHLVGGGVQKFVDRALGSGVNVKDFIAQGPLAGTTSKVTTRSNWETTIPSSRDLSDQETRSQYKNILLTTTPGRAPGSVAVGPAAKVLAQGLAYNTGGDKTEQIDLLNELKFSAAADPNATTAYNALVDTIHAAYDQRVQEIVQRAVASRTDPVEVARIKAAAEAAATAEKSNFTPI